MSTRRPCGMIMTVGVGGPNPSSLVGALKKSVERTNPDLLYLVCTKTSHQTADLLEPQLHKSIECHRYEISDENSVDKIFNDLIELIEWMKREHGCEADRLTVDYTSGTKAMSAAAILAAVPSGINRIQYIHGTRKEGTVIEGLEEISTASPTRCISFLNLQKALNNLRALRFSAALATLEEVQTDALPPFCRELPPLLVQLVEGYQAWDIFQQDVAFVKLRDAKSNHPMLNEYVFPRNNIGNLNGLQDALFPKSSKQDEQAQKGSIKKEVLADLFNNASRRMSEGKYDDACARLYRVTEMCAQFALQKHGIDTGHVQEEQIPENCRRKYCFDFEKGGKKEAKLGLHKSYELLLDLNNPIGEYVKPKSAFATTITTRNQSILAHGKEPVSRETCEALREHVYDLLQKIDKDIEKRCHELQFPWLANS